MKKTAKLRLKYNVPLNVMKKWLLIIRLLQIRLNSNTVTLRLYSDQIRWPVKTPQVCPVV